MATPDHMPQVAGLRTTDLRRRWQEFAEHRDFWLILAILGASVLLLGFGLLAGAVHSPSMTAIDRRILLALRSGPDDAIGPGWVEGFWLEVTSLGSVTVLCVVSLIAAGCLLILRRYRVTLTLTAGLIGGLVLTSALKAVVARPRPDFVTHLAAVSSPSFPSGHSMMAAIVYPTLGVILARAATRPLLKRYVIGVALCLMVLVGASRVYLGVHYATDVLAGWCIGLSWALFCWIVAHLLQRDAV